ncbi:MAG: M1 family metallopeptidase [Bacteroidetes bacterium]|nr:M1 family metallopeptidase [Bacteroidota bacterium]
MRYRLTFFITCTIFYSFGQYSKGDSLRGSINENRSWWDVSHYTLEVQVDIPGRFIRGKNTIAFKTISPPKLMQVDLQDPLNIDSAVFHSVKCKWTHFYNAWNIELPGEVNTTDSLIVYYSGKPRAARFPPWDGGFIWKKDDKGRDWVGVSCQGLGASVWWPNKDHQYDEPDKGMDILITTPDSLTNISNGKLISKIQNRNKTITWHHRVINPINNYDATINIGKYVVVKDSFEGKNGRLAIEYAVLDYNKDKIESHLKKDTKDMLRSLEYWFGPYPFYEDGYRLVETSYLGMEHQSAIAYGNKFKKGYLGTDRSKTGVGMLWDFIIIHESGHEWFGNNITCSDNADMWIHEGFTTYSEVLFLESTHGKDTANMYVIGLRKNIRNDVPVIGDYGVNKEGSGDMYDKGANMIHTIRQVINNDSVFHNILLGLNEDFAKKSVSTKQIESYISEKSGRDFSPVFDQYLRTSNIPVFEYTVQKGKIVYRFTNCNTNFKMPLKIITDKNEVLWLEVTKDKKEAKLPVQTKTVRVDYNFFILQKQGFTKNKQK